MPVINQMTVQDCTALSNLCPVEETIYGYFPDLAGNAFFLAFFLVAMLISIGQGVKYKTWTYMVALAVGSFAEAIGKSPDPIPAKSPSTNGHILLTQPIRFRWQSPHERQPLVTRRFQHANLLSRHRTRLHIRRSLPHAQTHRHRMRCRIIPHPRQILHLDLHWLRLALACAARCRWRHSRQLGPRKLRSGFRYQSHDCWYRVAGHHPHGVRLPRLRLYLPFPKSSPQRCCQQPDRIDSL